MFFEESPSVCPCHHQLAGIGLSCFRLFFCCPASFVTNLTDYSIVSCFISSQDSTSYFVVMSFFRHKSSEPLSVLVCCPGWSHETRLKFNQTLFPTPSTPPPRLSVDMEFVNFFAWARFPILNKLPKKKIINSDILGKMKMEDVFYSSILNKLSVFALKYILTSVIL